MDNLTILPDGSAFSVMSMPLPKDHWIYGDSSCENEYGYEPPPCPLLMRENAPFRVMLEVMVERAAKYAIRVSTMKGTEDFDPDALVRNIKIGLFGLYTEDGLSGTDAWANPIWARREDTLLINKTRLTDQLKKDEGFSPKAYWDVKQWTFGYGCRAPNKDATITEEEALVFLERKVDESIAQFKDFFGKNISKFNDVRAEAFINMIFNMGTGARSRPEIGGLGSFKNTLKLIFDFDEVDWQKVSSNLKQSKWFSQVGRRAERICKEVATGIK